MEPVRTCLGCRQRASRSSLVRVVARDGRAVADAAARLPGRGAWVHPVSGCVDTAIQRKAFGRALKVADLDCSELDGSGLLTSLSDFYDKADRPMDN